MTTYETYNALCKILGKSNKKPDDNGNVTFMCPNPKCKNPKPHLTINLYKELYHCWVCGFRGKGHKNCLKKLGFDREVDLYFVSFDKLINPNAEIRKFLHLDNDNDNDLQIPHGFNFIYKHRYDNKYTDGYNYLLSRSLTDDDIISYMIHYNPHSKQILIPSYDTNFNLNYYVCRNIEDNYTKYNNPNVSKNNFIFNEYKISWNEPVYIAEGVFDGIAIGRNVALLLGSTLSKYNKIYKKILEYRSDVILCLDPDAYNKSIQIASMLYKNNLNVKIVDLRENNPIDDIADIKVKYGCHMVNKILNNQQNFDTTYMIKHMIRRNNIYDHSTLC